MTKSTSSEMNTEIRTFVKTVTIRLRKQLFCNALFQFDRIIIGIYISFWLILEKEILLFGNLWVFVANHQ